jgi:hypothetical protein
VPTADKQDYIHDKYINKLGAQLRVAMCIAMKASMQYG